MDSSNNKKTKFFEKIRKILSFFDFKKIIMNFRNKEKTKQVDVDKKLVFSFSKSKIPSLKQLKYIKKYLSAKEIQIFKISFVVLVISLVFLGIKFYFTNLQTVPVEGGNYTEGLIGAPQYINPLYSSFSDVDSDISSLIFSSLLERDKDGKLINDLALSYEISEDNKTYTFKVRKDAVWHNNVPLVVDDIIFTFNVINDSRYNSPLEKSFVGVELEKIDEETIRFVLAEPYAAFLELLTFGILPQDLWYQILPSSAGLAELNLKPIGSGPYKFNSLTKDKTGQIKSYNLAVNKNYYGSEHYLEKISFVFFPNFEEAIDALNDGLVDSISYLPKQLEENLVAQDSLNLNKLNLPQLSAIFFNKKTNESLADKAVRQALALAINKNEIIQDNLGGDARLIDGPILPDSFAYNKDNKKYNYNKEEADELLDGAKWQKIEITEEDVINAEENIKNEDETTPDDPANDGAGGQVRKEAEEKIAMGVGTWRKKDDKFLIIRLTAVDLDGNFGVLENIKKFWEEIGVKTDIEPVQANQIQADIIKPRNFEALFYSQIVGADPD
ncbi:MAG TPA: hypothetical protein ENH26_02695, partial [Candidatus Wolfebacteria bacterium]|nr:hypothetical protein [Candidatus Wolfebacteria bacterium]